MELPPALLDSLNGVKGFDLQGFCDVHYSGEQITSVRFHPDKPSHALQTMKEGEIPWCKNAWYLSSRPSFTMDPVFHAGGYYVQEASSMFLWYLLEQVTSNLPVEGKLKILDLCAAPGGKSTLLSAFFKDGLVVSNEVIKSRASILVENITKWGQPNVIVTNNDPEHFQQLEAFFDVVLVDAPCSGSGLFRKDPAAIEEWSPQNVLHCSQRQERILSDIFPALKENGILIYSTCSYSPQEDEAIADWLVNEMGMAPLSLPVTPEWNIIQTAAPNSGAVGYRFYPNRIKGEGFYIAAFKKTGEPEGTKYKEVNLLRPSAAEMEMIHRFYPVPEGFSAFKQNEGIRIMATEWMEVLKQLAKQLYIKKAGIEIGAIKGKDLIPSHELAVAALDKSILPTIPVTQEQALQFLKRIDLKLDAPKGWHLLVYDGLGLGWVKVLPNRVNNYYPAEWRILKH